MVRDELVESSASGVAFGVSVVLGCFELGSVSSLDLVSVAGWRAVGSDILSLSMFSKPSCGLSGIDINLIGAGPITLRYGAPPAQPVPSPHSNPNAPAANRTRFAQVRYPLLVPMPLSRIRLTLLLQWTRYRPRRTGPCGSGQVPGMCAHGLSCRTRGSWTSRLSAKAAAA